VETRVHGVDSAADGDDAGGLKACNSPCRHLAGFAAWSHDLCQRPWGAPIAQTTPRRLHCLHQTGIKASAAQTPSFRRRRLWRKRGTELPQTPKNYFGSRPFHAGVGEPGVSLFTQDFPATVATAAWRADDDGAATRPLE
jgi:hypothetical protein